MQIGININLQMMPQPAIQAPSQNISNSFTMSPNQKEPMANIISNIK